MFTALTAAMDNGHRFPHRVMDCSQTSRGTIFCVSSTWFGSMTTADSSRLRCKGFSVISASVVPTYTKTSLPGRNSSRNRLPTASFVNETHGHLSAIGPHSLLRKTFPSDAIRSRTFTKTSRSIDPHDTADSLWAKVGGADRPSPSRSQPRSPKIEIVTIRLI
jgi:hypothetical protein